MVSQNLIEFCSSPKDFITHGGIHFGNLSKLTAKLFISVAKVSNKKFQI